MPKQLPELTDADIDALRIRRILAVGKRLKRRREKRVPIQKLPRGAQLEYMAGLKKIQKTISDTTREIIFPELSSFQLSDSEFITRKINSVRFAVAEKISIDEINALTSKVGTQLSLFNRAEVGKQLKSVIGVDIITAEPWLDDHLITFRKENVNLIKSLQGTELDDVENILLRGFRRGERVEVLRDNIVSRFGVSENKAMLIARDQTMKLNGELTQLRQQSIGVKSYIWRASLDERVRGNPEGKYPDARPSHYARDGKRFFWDKPPSEDAYDGHPGFPINCRCRAEPDLSHLIGEEYAPVKGRRSFANSELLDYSSKRKRK